MTPQRPATAIVPYAAAIPKIVQFAADGVAADVRVEPLRRMRRTNVYAIRLASADAYLTGRLIGVLPSGDAVELGDVAVAPGSIGSARLAVAAPRGGFRTVYLEIRSERVLLQIEAPKPQPRRLHPLAVAATALALGAVSLGGGTLALAIPQPPVLRGPDRATAGDAVHVQYVTRGYGTGQYTARYDDGVVFASGALDTQSGAITVAVPNAAVNRRVSVAVSTHGLLGDAAGVTSFSVVAPRIEDVPARVLSFAARRDVGTGGETVLASYLAVADRGVVSLQDDRGTVIASAPFTHVGTNRLAVAPAYRDRPLTARISVDHGATHAVASVALPAPGAASVPETPNAAAVRPPIPVEEAPQAPIETAGMLVFEGRVIAGTPLSVSVMPHRTPMTVAMQDATGETLAEREIAPGTTHVTLPLPEQPAIYYVLLRYDDEDGAQTLVRPVRAVAPAPDHASSR